MKRPEKAAGINLAVHFVVVIVLFASSTGLITAQTNKGKHPPIAVVPVSPEGTPTGFGVVTGNNIDYHGGPVMVTPHNVYFIWYGNWNGNTATTILPAFITGLNHSFTSIPTSRMLSSTWTSQARATSWAKPISPTR